ncbi:MAG: hypothetical protein IH597_03585 [Bacteroidales bacterium]|nr:hypothetical protein [Bacteroidales bacterium]
MAQTKTIIGLIVLMFPLFEGSLIAQVRVTGHIFAEVVESIGTSSNTNDWVMVPQSSSGKEFDLGEISLNGGAMAAYDLIVKTNVMTGEAGTQASFLATTDLGNLSYMLDSHGKRVFRLYGSVKEKLCAEAEKNFSASYHVIFAYN